jgi:hypothetical protein
MTSSKTGIRMRLRNLFVPDFLAVEFGNFAPEHQLNCADRAVPLFGQDNLGDVGAVRIRVVIIIPVDKDHHIRRLLDFARLAQVRKHRAFIGALLDGAAPDPHLAWRVTLGKGKHLDLFLDAHSGQLLSKLARELWLDLQISDAEDEANPGYYKSTFYLRPHYQLEA